MVSREESPLASRALARLGTMLLGRYRLVRLIGIGGMGAVYAGVHRNGHAVAVKILHDRLSNDPEIERLFRREAHLANNVNHPGVVPVIDDDVAEDGCVFLVMPLLDGDTLRGRWERHERRLPLDEVVVVAHAVLEVLQAAHAKKIVHRDIKPDNIFIERSGAVRVLDFGIARFFETSDPASATRSGRAIGTPAFMAPEQALGRLREVDGRTDIWALGATIFATLSGQFVHQAETGSEVIVHAATRPARPLSAVVPDMPAVIAAVVDRALAFDRGERWPDAAAMDRALLAAYEEAFARPISAIEPLVSAPSPLTGTDVHSALTQAPVVAAAPEADVTPATDAGAAAIGNVGGAQPALAEAISQGTPAGNTNTAVERSAGTRSARSLPRRALGLVALASALAASVGFFAYRRAQVKAPTDAGAQPPPAAVDDGVTKHLEASRRAWIDGDFERARKEARDAIALNDTYAPAHLALVVAAPFWPGAETRTHFVKAQEGRDALTPSQRDFVEAIAPAMTAPANFRLAADRLEVVAKKTPDDLVTRIALVDQWMRLGALDRPRELLKDAAADPSAPGVVLARYAAVAALRDDLDEARATFSRCVDNFPGSNLCANHLAELELNEGRCAAAERILRKELSTSPNADAYHKLGYALHGLGLPPSEVTPVLEKWAELSPGGGKERNSLRVQIRDALLRGKLRDALTLHDKLGALLDRVDDDPEHFDDTLHRMGLEAELGDNAAAASTLQKYVAARHRFQRTVDADDYAIHLIAHGVEFGFVPWSSWLPQRTEKLAHPDDRVARLDGRPRAWLDLFALPATTRDEAQEALAELPKYLPVLQRSDRDFWNDGAIGRVYALTGQPDAALPYYERAAASCNALEDLVQYTRTLIEFGALLERRGDRSRACEVYRKVLTCWPPESGSVSATRAIERQRAVCRTPSGTRPRQQSSNGGTP